MSNPALAPDPPLRERFPLYPAQFFSAVAMISLGPLLDSMMSDLDIPLDQGGLVSVGLFLGQVLGIIMLNTLLAHLPAKWTLVAGALLQAVGLTLAGAVSWDLWSLGISYLIVGLGWALLNTIGWIWVASHVRRQAASAALLMIVFFALGMMITPLVIGLALGAGAEWRWILVTEGIICFALASVFAALRLLDVPGRQNVRRTHVKQVYAHNPGLLLGIVGASLMYVGAETNLNVWLPKFQIETFGAGDLWASLSVTLFWLGLVTGRLIARPLSRRFDPSRMLLFCSCALTIMALAISLAPTQAAALVFSVGAGLGASASYALIGSYAARFPGWQSGVASSLFALFGGVGSMLFPYLVGPVADSVGFRAALALTAVPAAAYGLFSLLIHARAAKEG